jgi:hypothetical protein
MDTQSTSTIETALNCSKILKELGYEKAWIVTDGYHMSRSMLAFRVLGIHGEAARPDSIFCPSTRVNMSKARAREVFACAASAPRIFYLYAVQLWKGTSKNPVSHLSLIVRTIAATGLTPSRRGGMGNYSRCPEEGF